MLRRNRIIDTSKKPKGKASKAAAAPQSVKVERKKRIDVAPPKGLSAASLKMREIAREKIFRAVDTPVNIEQAMKDTLNWIPKDDPVTIMMSSGVDSHLCLWAALELGLNVNIASFTLDTHESTDFLAAKHAAEEFGLDFHPVILKTSEKALKKWVLFAVNELGLRGKAAIECHWPQYRLIEKMAGKTKHLVSGICGDSYFLMAKSQSMHCKDLVAECRRKSFRRTMDQNDMLRRECFKHGIFAHLPFLTDGRMYAELVEETDYDTINKPEKVFFNQAFPEYRKRCKVKRHQNFQLGDTNISGIFSDVLLRSDWNKRNAKAIVAVYNDVANGVIKR